MSSCLVGIPRAWGSGLRFRIWLWQPSDGQISLSLGGIVLCLAKKPKPQTLNLNSVASKEYPKQPNSCPRVSRVFGFRALGRQHASGLEMG